MELFNRRASTLLMTWLAILLLATAGCASPEAGSSDCETGTMGCECYGNDTCNDGMRCADSVCIADGGSDDDDDDAGLNEPGDADVDAGEDVGVEDAGVEDAGEDAGVEDAGVEDAGEDAGVEDAGVEADECEGIEAPAGAIFDGSRNTLPYAFGDEAEWANGISVGTELFVLNEYVSLEFVAPDVAGHVAWSVGGGNTGTFRVRLSSCPHDFRTRDEAPEDVTYCTLEGEEGWTNGLIDGTPDPTDWRCNLVPGETYYLNIMLAECPQSQCNFYGTLREN